MKSMGNTILITGGTSGIGLGFAERFLQLDNRVMICGRRGERLEQIKEKHPEIETIVCDVTDPKQRETLRDRVVQNFPETNVLMNNAGIQLHTDLTKPIDLEKVRTEIETNLTAPVHLVSLFAKHLASKKEAAIINISSGLAFAPISPMPVYCATKAAIHSLTLSLRHQLRATSVKVFEIVPPAVDTELGHQQRTDKSQSHGGIPVLEFIDESMKAIENDTFEAAIGMAKDLREKREELFKFMNR